MQFFIQCVDMMIFVIGDKFVIQWIVSIYIVGMYVNNWFEQVLFGIGVDIKFLLVVVLFFVVQFVDQCVYLVGNGLFIRKVSFC